MRSSATTSGHYVASPLADFKGSGNAGCENTFPSRKVKADHDSVPRCRALLLLSLHLLSQHCTYCKRRKTTRASLREGTANSSPSVSGYAEQLNLPLLNRLQHLIRRTDHRRELSWPQIPSQVRRRQYGAGLNPGSCFNTLRQSPTGQAQENVRRFLILVPPIAVFLQSQNMFEKYIRRILV